MQTQIDRTIQSRHSQRVLCASLAVASVLGCLAEGASAPSPGDKPVGASRYYPARGLFCCLAMRTTPQLLVMVLFMLAACGGEPVVETGATLFETTVISACPTGATAGNLLLSPAQGGPGTQIQVTAVAGTFAVSRRLSVTSMLGNHYTSSSQNTTGALSAALSAQMTASPGSYAVSASDGTTTLCTSFTVLSPALILTPSSSIPYQAFTATVSGFRAGSTVTITASDFNAQTWCNADGTGGCSVPLTAASPVLGAHAVTASGSGGLTASASYQITAPRLTLTGGFGSFYVDSTTTLPTLPSYEAFTATASGYRPGSSVTISAPSFGRAESCTADATGSCNAALVSSATPTGCTEGYPSCFTYSVSASSSGQQGASASLLVSFPGLEWRYDPYPSLVEGWDSLLHRLVSSYRPMPVRGTFSRGGVGYAPARVVVQATYAGAFSPSQPDATSVALPTTVIDASDATVDVNGLVAGRYAMWVVDAGGNRSDGATPILWIRPRVGEPAVDVTSLTAGVTTPLHVNGFRFNAQAPFQLNATLDGQPLAISNVTFNGADALVPGALVTTPGSHQLALWFPYFETQDQARIVSITVTGASTTSITPGAVPASMPQANVHITGTSFAADGSCALTATLDGQPVPVSSVTSTGANAAIPGSLLKIGGSHSFVVGSCGSFTQLTLTVTGADPNDRCHSPFITGVPVFVSTDNSSPPDPNLSPDNNHPAQCAGSPSWDCYRKVVSYAPVAASGQKTCQYYEWGDLCVALASALCVDAPPAQPISGNGEPSTIGSSCTASGALAYRPGGAWQSYTGTVSGSSITVLYCGCDFTHASACDQNWIKGEVQGYLTAWGEWDRCSPTNPDIRVGSTAWASAPASYHFVASGATAPLCTP